MSGRPPADGSGRHHRSLSAALETARVPYPAHRGRPAMTCGPVSRAQKCWAYLLRKAIGLALLYPRQKSYQHFLDRLTQAYHDAKQAAASTSVPGRGNRPWCVRHPRSGGGTAKSTASLAPRKENGSAAEERGVRRGG